MHVTFYLCFDRLLGSEIIFEWLLFICSYDVMRKCWQTVPSERPSFSELYMALDVLVTRLMSSQERD